MVYGFVRQSGGSMLIESREGYGSRIRFTCRSRARSAVRVEASTDVVRGHGQGIVVVEDDEAVRELPWRSWRRSVTGSTRSAPVARPCG